MRPDACELSQQFGLARYFHSRGYDKRAFYAYCYGSYEAGMFILSLYDAYMMGGEL